MTERVTDRDLMHICVFAKSVKTRENKTFVKYICRLIREDGSTETATVKFGEECAVPKPAACPMNILVLRKTANVSMRKYTDAHGNPGIGYTLWVNDWQEDANNPYEDHSTDEFI